MHVFFSPVTCSSRLSIEHAHADVLSIAVGGFVEVKCMPGYGFDSGAKEYIAWCQPDGTWSVVEPCAGTPFTNKYMMILYDAQLLFTGVVIRMEIK